MAGRRKKSAEKKAVTVTSVPAPKKKRGKEKKPTLTLGAAVVSDAEKPEAKSVKPKLQPKAQPTTAPKAVPKFEPAVKEPAVKEPAAPPAEPVVLEPAAPPASPAPAEQPTSPAPAEKAEQAPQKAEQAPQKKPKRPPRRISVLFVCTGNTCRSAMAQYIFSEYVSRKGESEYFDVSGAGLSALTGDDMSEQAKQALFERGITGINHFARRLTREMVEKSDLVVCMTEGHYRTIGSLPNVTTIARITGGADVPDPWGGTLDDYRKVAAYLEYACGDVYDFALESAKRTKSQI